MSFPASFPLRVLGSSKRCHIYPEIVSTASERCNAAGRCISSSAGWAICGLAARKERREILEGILFTDRATVEDAEKEV